MTPNMPADREITRSEESDTEGGAGVDTSLPDGTWNLTRTDLSETDSHPFGTSRRIWGA